MSEYVAITLETIAFLKRFNGGTADLGDMIVFRVSRRLERELSEYLTGGDR